MVSLNCPKCHASDIVKRGKRYNKSGVKQLYRCNTCRSTFVEPNGFERMRHKPKVIVRAIHMHNDGMSLFNVQTHLWQHDGIKVSLWAISKWHKKYSVFLKSDALGGKAKAKGKTAFGREIYPNKRRKK